MTFGRTFRQVYIRLVENEPEFVCTVNYGGFFGKSTQVRLKIRPEGLPGLEDESLPIVRTGNRVDAKLNRASWQARLRED